MSSESDRLCALYYHTNPQSDVDAVLQCAVRAREAFCEVTGDSGDLVSAEIVRNDDDTFTFALRIEEFLSDADTPRVVEIEFGDMNGAHGVIYTNESMFDLFARLLLRELNIGKVVDDDDREVIILYEPPRAMVNLDCCSDSLSWFSGEIVERLVFAGLAGGSSAWRMQFRHIKVRKALPDMAF